MAPMKITLLFPRRTCHYVGAMVRESRGLVLDLSNDSSIGVRDDGQGWVHQTWDRRRSAVVAGDMLGTARPVAGRVSWRIGWWAYRRGGAACRRLERGRWRVCPRETRQWIHRRHRSSQRARVH